MRKIAMQQVMAKRSMRWALLLAGALALPGSTFALPTDSADIDATAPHRAEAPSVPSIWERPANPEPVIVVRPPQALPAAAESTPSANPLWAVPLATLSNTRERPIFSASRRPPPAAVAAAPVEKPPPPPPKPTRVELPPLSLVGTVAGSAESYGIFVDQTTKAALRLKLGEDYQGWKLRSILGREATLERDQQSAILSLPQPGAAAGGQARTNADGASAPRTVGSTSQREERR
jgi:hypothetical protein